MSDRTNYLILIKHSLPEIKISIPASKWQLSQVGRARCQPLAKKLATYKPEAIYSSLEPKAIETAEIAANALGLENSPYPDLHEHLRESVVFADSVTDFKDFVKRFFARPDRVVFGEESANQAQARFDRAVSKLLLERPNQTIAVVAHGTVITLFVALYHPIDVYTFWDRLTLPSMVVLILPNLNLANIEYFS